MRERFPCLQQLHAADMVSTLRGIERFQHLFLLRKGQPYFELIEQPLVVGALRAVEKFQRILDVIRLRAIGELHGIERGACIKLQALRIPHIEIQPEVLLQVRIEGIAVFDQHEYLRFLAVIEGIVSDVECLSVHGAVLQIIHDVGLLKLSGFIGRRGGQVSLPAHDRAQTHKKQ